MKQLRMGCCMELIRMWSALYRNRNISLVVHDVNRQDLLIVCEDETKSQSLSLRRGQGSADGTLHVGRAHPNELMSFACCTSVASVAEDTPATWPRPRAERSCCARIAGMMLVTSSVLGWKGTQKGEEPKGLNPPFSPPPGTTPMLI
jgi:hypothetical protein